MSEMKKVKLLVHGTALGNCGDIVEVPAQVAEHMCAERDHHDGYKLHKIRVAMSAEEAMEIEQSASQVSEKDLASMSQAEAEAMGIKNITQSDPEDIGAVNKIAAAKKSKGKK
jgi:hypothetical protein